MSHRTSTTRMSKWAILIDGLRRFWPWAGEEAFHLRERFRYRRQFAGGQTKFWRDHFSPRNPKVLSGPFEGMRYLKGTVMGPPLPRWLGTYEAELHETFRSKIFGKTYELIVVVGSAEGFYACGLGRQFPKTRILSFETTLISRWQQRMLLRMNQVTNVEVHGRLSAEDFLDLVKDKKCLCLLDIEGAEVEFCRHEALPALARSDLVIEIHSWGAQNPTEVLQQITGNLAASHRTQVLSQVPRRLSEIRKRTGLHWSVAELQEAADEHRGFDQQWLWAEAKKS
jgi:hypothetical protein